MHFRSLAGQWLYISPFPAGIFTGALRHEPGETSKPGKLSPCSCLCFSTPRMLLPADSFTFHSDFTIWDEAFKLTEREINAKQKGSWFGAARLEQGSWRRHIQLSIIPIPLSEERDLIQTIYSNFSVGILETDAQFLHQPTRSEEWVKVTNTPKSANGRCGVAHCCSTLIAPNDPSPAQDRPGAGPAVSLSPPAAPQTSLWQSCSFWQRHQHQEPPKNTSPGNQWLLLADPMGRDLGFKGSPVVSDLLQWSMLLGAPGTPPSHIWASTDLAGAFRVSFPISADNLCDSVQRASSLTPEGCKVSRWKRKRIEPWKIFKYKPDN